MAKKRHKMVNSKKVMLTAAQNTARDAEEAAWAADNTAAKKKARAEAQEINHNLVMLKTIAALTGKTLTQARAAFKAARS